MRIKDRGHGSMDAGDLSVVTYQDPHALVFRGAQAMALFARVCGECGHTELFVENPRELYERYRSGQGS
ncbi:MAG: hypothetical protein JNK48_09630 [Bryobacterales bacterium]|nr:hypothetical protein [Bryobacterales bacterium]